jgi:putative permease
MRLPQRYPELFSEAQIRDLIDTIRIEALSYGQHVVSLSVSSVVSVITIAVYVILMPLLVFFFLKDKDRIIKWFLRFLPQDRGLLSQVWLEVDRQIGNYVRGKFIEILIVWVTTYLTFVIMGMSFAMLLGVLVGLSVLIPYIGAAAVTLPVAILAYFQWGLTPEFWWLLVAYGIIQALDGNVLVPLLFSEVVDLHPVAIIVAVLVFGGLWGFWGVFFAIPLATLVQAVLKAWPKFTGDDKARA